MSETSSEFSTSEVCLIQEAELEEFYNAFSELKTREDEDVIEVKNFSKFMRLMGQNATEAEMIEMLREVHAFQNETITFDQIVIIMSRHFKSPHTDDEIRAAFKVFDREDEGFLTVNSVSYIMNNLGLNYEEDEVNEMFLQADIDRDGKIRVEDFLRLMKGHKKMTLVNMLANQRRK